MSVTFSGSVWHCLGVCDIVLTALTLDSSLQVLSRPFCRTSFCWTRFWMAAALDPFCSLSSWLADNSAVSSVCCNTQYTHNCRIYTNEHIEKTLPDGCTFSLRSCWSFSSCILTALSCSHSLLSLVWYEQIHISKHMWLHCILCNCRLFHYIVWLTSMSPSSVWWIQGPPL